MKEKEIMLCWLLYFRLWLSIETTWKTWTKPLELNNGYIQVVGYKFSRQKLTSCIINFMYNNNKWIEHEIKFQYYLYPKDEAYKANRYIQNRCRAN